MYNILMRHKDSDGNELELFHNPLYDEYFLKIGDKSVQVDYKLLNDLTDEFLKYNNYFEDVEEMSNPCENCEDFGSLECTCCEHY